LNTPISLQTAFDSRFHHKLSFDDFLNLDVTQEYQILDRKKQLILNPTAKLKKYLRFLNSFIFNEALVNANVVHSYRQGRNAYTAVEKHANSKYFFQTDIQNFFSSITTEIVGSVLDKNLSNAISDIHNYKDQLLNFIVVNNTLPVGFPTSPSITNTCLYDFDNALESYCLKKGIIYTRYSDDIILSSNNINLNNIENIVSEYLELFFNDKLLLNTNKTKHTHKGKKIKILGMVVLPCGKVSVDMKLKKQLEILFYFYINDKEKFEDYLTNKFKGELSTISGQLDYINTVDQSYLDKLRKKYGNFIIDKFYRLPKEKKGKGDNEII